MAEPWLTWVNPSDLSFNLAFPTTTNTAYAVEATASLATPSWQPLTLIQGDGVEKIVKQPMQERHFFRVRKTQ